MKNRALEFLNEAHGLIEYYSNRQTAQTLIRLAIDEVVELLEENYQMRQRLAMLEALQLVRTTALSQPNGGAVLIEEAMQPALLTESPHEVPALNWLKRKALELSSR